MTTRKEQIAAVLAGAPAAPIEDRPDDEDGGSGGEGGEPDEERVQSDIEEEGSGGDDAESAPGGDGGDPPSNPILDLFGELTKEDIVDVMPEAYVTGASLYVRLGGPRGKEEWMDRMRTRVPKKSRARSGWMAGAALIIAANRKKLQDAGVDIGRADSPPHDEIEYSVAALRVARRETVKMSNHLNVFIDYLTVLALCIRNKSEDSFVICCKSDTPYKVYIPVVAKRDDLCKWCAARWPKSDEDIGLGITLDESNSVTDDEYREFLKAHNPERLREEDEAKAKAEEAAGAIVP